MDILNGTKASQPQWKVGNQLQVFSERLSCPTGDGQLDCLREKNGTELQKVLLDSGNQFQPVIDNITIFKDYVKQTREGRTARIPLLIGTNKVSLVYTFIRRFLIKRNTKRMKGR